MYGAHAPATCALCASASGYDRVWFTDALKRRRVTLDELEAAPHISEWSRHHGIKRAVYARDLDRLEAQSTLISRAIVRDAIRNVKRRATEVPIDWVLERKRSEARARYAKGARARRVRRCVGTTLGAAEVARIELAPLVQAFITEGGSFPEEIIEKLAAEARAREHARERVHLRVAGVFGDNAAAAVVQYASLTSVLEDDACENNVDMYIDRIVADLQSRVNRASDARHACRLAGVPFNVDIFAEHAPVYANAFTSHVMRGSPLSAENIFPNFHTRIALRRDTEEEGQVQEYAGHRPHRSDDRAHRRRRTRHDHCDGADRRL